MKKIVSILIIAMVLLTGCGNIKEKHEFNKTWISECYRILKDSGTIWISRNITQYIFNRNGIRRGRI